jgi:hypothetical protein
MTLFERALEAEKIIEEEKLSCVGCFHLYFFKSGTPFCKKKRQIYFAGLSADKMQIKGG